MGIGYRLRAIGLFHQGLSVGRHRRHGRLQGEALTAHMGCAIALNLSFGGAAGGKAGGSLGFAVLRLGWISLAGLVPFGSAPYQPLMEV